MGGGVFFDPRTKSGSDLFVRVAFLHRNSGTCNAPNGFEGICRDAVDCFRGKFARVVFVTC